MRSTFKILFYLARNKQKKDGTIPIMCRITVNGTIVQFSCKLQIEPEVWDSCNSQTFDNTPNAKRIGRELSSIRKGIEKHYRSLFNGVGPLTADRVKRSYLGLDRYCRTLLQVFRQHNEDYIHFVERGCRSISTYRNYCMGYNYVNEYINSKYKMDDIALADLQYNFITEFEIFLREKKGCSINSIFHYITSLRKMIAISRDNGWLVHNPFSNYHIKKVQVERAYLTMREIDMLMNTKYSKERHSMLRDFFIFCCYTGVPHVDFRLLSKENLKEIDGKWWLFYKRHKTKVQSSVMLLDIPLNIIKKYKGSTGGDRLFPMPKEGTVNRNIKEVAKLAGIEKDTSWHVSRHTFATEICLMNGVPIETISRMLGHTNVKTTQIYTRISDTIIERDMNILAEKLNKRSFLRSITDGADYKK